MPTTSWNSSKRSCWVFLRTEVVNWRKHHERFCTKHSCHTKKQTHRVVFEVNVDGAEQWQGILNNVENLQKSFGSGTTELEVVAHGKGLGLILKINESMRARLQLVSGAGVCFAACENTMRRLNLKLEDLMPFATTVDSGVAEVVLKQEAGWSYIKSGS